MTPPLIPSLLAGSAAGCALASLGARTDPRIHARIASLSLPAIDAGRTRFSVSALRAMPQVHGVLAGHTARARRKAVERQVLEFVELLLAATEAGLPPAAAVQRAAELVRGPLGEELQRAGREIALGLDWRAALEEVCSRTQASGLRRLMSALSRAHRLGTSAQSSLRAIADELRTEYRTRAEEVARRAPVKMLLPGRCRLTCGFPATANR